MMKGARWTDGGTKSDLGTKQKSTDSDGEWDLIKGSAANSTDQEETDREHSW